MEVHQIQIPGYKIIREIGFGGMATVYLAEQLSLNRPVALKVMAPVLVADPTFGERFLKEAKTVARLVHPHILAIYDIGAAGHYHYMAMEYLAGDDLKARIQHGLNPDQAMGILRQVASALGYAHKEGFVHRDIKPENMLFRKDGTVVLTDFGIAKAIGAATRMTKTGMSIGTPHYMSPEQARGKAVDGRSDLYSLGVVFYEMLTGKVPYEAEETFAVGLMHINDPVPELPASLSSYQHFVDRLLAKNPADRFVDAAELVATIGKVQTGQQVARPAAATRVIPAAKESAMNQTSQHVRSDQQPPRKGNGLLWGLGGALAALAIAGGVYFYNQQNWRPLMMGDAAPSKVIQSIPQSTTPSPQSQPLPASRELGSDKNNNIVQEKSAKIARLLSQAEEDLAATRLTTPVNNNAFERYQEVLALDNENIRARQGLKRIVEKYIKLSNSALEKYEFDRANGYLVKAGEILPGSEAVIAARKRVEAAQSAKLKEVVRKYIKLSESALEEDEFDRANGYLVKAGEILPGSEAVIAARKRVEAAQSAKLKEVVRKYIKLSESALEKDEFDRANGYLVKAGKILPESQAVIAARKRVVEAAQTAKLEQDRLNAGPTGDVWREPMTGMEFVFVPGGCFQMGDTFDDGGDDEKPVHEICVDGFYIGRYEVTQSEWQQIMDFNPAEFKKGGRYPVENVSWEDTQEYIQKLNEKTGKSFRLPTEAEWEYAARSGGKNEKYSGANSPDAVAWYRSNIDDTTHQVGGKRANGLGIYDMSGNVWEWCRDWYGPNYYSESPKNNPSGPSEGSYSYRVYRGGSWYDRAGNNRTAQRYPDQPQARLACVGFRLSLALK